MTEKIKVWKCDECDKGCLSADLDEYEPEMCLVTANPDPLPIWKQTDEFKIIRNVNLKEDEKGVFPLFYYFTEKDRMSDFLKNRVEPVTVPNCSICEWSEKFEKLESTTKYLVAPILQCTAQGFKDASECYNSAECQKLFTEKPW